MVSHLFFSQLALLILVWLFFLLLYAWPSEHARCPNPAAPIATRQHYIQIYQAIKYLSLDVAAFLEKGPQLAEFPDV
jgi:hypothetical protein